MLLLQSGLAITPAGSAALKALLLSSTRGAKEVSFVGGARTLAHPGPRHFTSSSSRGSKCLKSTTITNMWTETLSKVGSEKHPNNIGKTIQYGTAGFRCSGDLLDHVMYRMGALAVVRSKQKQATIGVMITASHNPEEDNGVKLVDPMGEMLENSWEDIATRIANAEDSKLGKMFEELVAEHKIDLSKTSSVFVGCDTRKSSPGLVRAVLDGVDSVGGTSRDFGIVSTPILHYNVVCQNTNGAYGKVGEEGYCEKLASAFKKIRGENTSNGNYTPDLKFDGANGVGALKMRQMLPYLSPSINIVISNDGSSEGDVLNHACGADFVKVQQAPPKGFEASRGERCASVDGDADRVIFFYNDKESGRFNMLDGDKIATLVAGYLKELLSGAHLDINLGLVQTAYANGSSTNYITKTLNVPVACVPTGVKYLHHKALEFDIGVYFEANGHGTVVFSDAAQARIKDAAARSNSAAAQKLAALMDVINQTVGDAISDMLLVESILHSKGWSIQDWSTAYTDLPNRQTKVKVADRNVFVTGDAERKVVKPAGLQGEIDGLVGRYKEGRSFVRPSGTEDIVRVYAEAATQEEADDLAYEVGLKVHALAGGVGEPTPRSK